MQVDNIKHEVEEKQQCPICYLEMCTYENAGIPLPCDNEQEDKGIHHLVCSECIRDMVLKHSSVNFLSKCPMCRGNVKKHLLLERFEEKNPNENFILTVKRAERVDCLLTTFRIL